MNSAEFYRRQADEMLARAELAEKINALVDRGEGFVPGTVVTFRKTYNASGRVFDYAAIKCDNSAWYITGLMSVGPFLWDKFVEWLGESILTVRVATHWVDLMEVSVPATPESDDTSEPKPCTCDEHSNIGDTGGGCAPSSTSLLSDAPEWTS